MTKRKGGLYAWRTDKPHAVIGLPFIGRHWSYCGMTNSYYFRGKQHLEGSTKYGAPAANWSDLRPKCYRILPLPDFILHGKYRRRVTFALETVMIWVLCPVYNDTQQAPYNLRKVSRARAARERARRDELGRAYRMAKAFLRALVQLSLAVIAVVIYANTKGF